MAHSYAHSGTTQIIYNSRKTLLSYLQSQGYNIEDYDEFSINEVLAMISNNQLDMLVNEAIFTFVAVDKNGNPVKVPQLLPETEIEKQRFDAALRRRQLSLVLAGKLQAKDATELKALFD